MSSNRNNKNLNTKVGKQEAGMEKVRQQLAALRKEMGQRGLADSKIVQMMLDPEDSEAARWEDDSCTAAAVFKAKEVVDLPSANGWSDATRSSSVATRLTSTAIQLPGISGSIAITAATATVAATPALIDFGQVQFKGSGAFAGQAIPNDIASAVTGSPTELRYLVPHVQTDGNALYEASISWAAAGSAIVIRSDYHGPWNALFAVSIGGADFGNVLASVNGAVTFTAASLSLTTPVTSTAFFIRIIPQPTNSRVVYAPINVTMYKEAGYTGTVSIPIGQGNLSVLDYTQLLDLDKTEAFRVIAMSSLVTYCGSDLANGGEIAAAWLPPDLAYWDNVADPYDYLAQTPNDSYDGALKNGSYCWYKPAGIRSYIYRPYETYGFTNSEGLPTLSTFMTRADPTQPVRLKATIIVEAQTVSPLYAVSTAVPHPGFTDTMRFLRMANSACENPEHKNLLSEAWKRAKPWMKKMASDPSNWAKAASVAASLFP